MASPPKELLEVFIGETQVLIENINNNMLKIEKGNADEESINALYRDIHSLKGNSYFCEIKGIGNITHAMESSLELIRDQGLNVESDHIDVLLKASDLIFQSTEWLTEHGEEADNHDKLNEIIELLNNITQKIEQDVKEGKTKQFSADKPSESTPIQQDPSPPVKKVKVENPPPQEETHQTPPVHVAEPKEAAPASTATEPQKPIDRQESSAPTIDASKNTETPEKSEDDTQGAEDHREAQPAPKPQVTAQPMPTKAKSNPESQKKSEPAPQSEKLQKAETLRVPVPILDKLMNLASELVLIRNQVIQAVDSEKDSKFSKISQSLNSVTAELQDEVMKTRMQPIGNVVSKFRRVVRDIGRELKKKIELDLRGVDTELDKTLIEAIHGPLNHIVRNSMDHGLETPQERVEAGKPEVGTICINSFHEGGQVVIEISDDGRGIDAEKVKAKAIEKSLITSAQAESLSEAEIYNLIFTPGFSTAAAVTNISGRGVGMDVVKTNIQQIGGVVDLSSTPGMGSCVRIQIPLTLAVVPGLIVKAKNESFAIPQVKLVELVRVEHKPGAQSQIENLQGSPVFRLRGRLLPLISLWSILNGENGKDMGEFDGINEDDYTKVINIVVLKADSLQFGLLVDQVEDSVDIVVKPLSQVLKNLSIYSGASVMGDGSVILTLDIAGIANKLKLFEQNTTESEPEVVSTAQSKDIHDRVVEAVDYVVVEMPFPGKYVIPVCLVNRLEEIERDQIEISNGQAVAQYRDRILPIIKVSDYLDADSSLPEESHITTQTNIAPIIVIEKSGRLYGLEVSQIVDVEEISTLVDENFADRRGSLGCLLHKDEVFVVVDAHNIIRSSQNQSYNKTGQVQQLLEDGTRKTRDRFKVLVVEDNSFFRNVVSSVLTEAGYKVDLAFDGQLGLNKLEQDSSHYDLVLSDIEMPNLDGFGLAKEIRKREKYQNLPLIALTTKCSTEDIRKGKEAGFNYHLEKLSGDQLLNTLDQTLGVMEA